MSEYRDCPSCYEHGEPPEVYKDCAEYHEDLGQWLCDGCADDDRVTIGSYGWEEENA